jgi:hypothetical protein
MSGVILTESSKEQITPFADFCEPRTGAFALQREKMQAVASAPYAGTSPNSMGEPCKIIDFPCPSSNSF